MMKTVHGIVHGKIIQLDEDLGVAEGQKVELQVKTAQPRKVLPRPPPGWRPGGTNTVAGLLAKSWTDEDDQILEEIYQDRKRSSSRETPE